MIRAFAILLAALPGAAAALGLDMPGNARLIHERQTGPDSYAIPTGPFTDDGGLPSQQVSGNVSRQVFRVESAGLTTLQLIEPLRAQLEAAGVEILLDCATDQCGGFDFRFKTEVVPAPDMYVDLTDFRFLSARHISGSVTEHLSLMVSRSDLAGYVQLIRVSSSRISKIGFSSRPVVRGVTSGLAGPDEVLPVDQALSANGFAILTDLAFETGSANLGKGSFASLDTLAAYLGAHPGQRLALVGHTDAEGSLKNNIALSKRRAASVLERLVSEYGIDRARLDAEGVGYLSPVASNLSAEGREANRRVEAVLLAVE